MNLHVYTYYRYIALYANIHSYIVTFLVVLWLYCDLHGLIIGNMSLYTHVYTYLYV